jgi:hypothetical protein
MAVTSQLRAGDLFGDIPVRDWQKAKPFAIRPVFATIHRCRGQCTKYNGDVKRHPEESPSWNT